MLVPFMTTALVDAEVGGQIACNSVFFLPFEMTLGHCQKKGGKLHNVQMHDIRRLNLSCIADFKHMVCLTYHAFPHLSEHGTSFQAFCWYYSYFRACV